MKVWYFRNYTGSDDVIEAEVSAEELEEMKKDSGITIITAEE